MFLEATNYFLYYKLFIGKMKFVKNMHLEDGKYLLTIERSPYLLNKSVQTVYKYFIDGDLVITYYTNGWNTNLYPVYHMSNLEDDARIWTKEKLDLLLSKYLPGNH